MHDRRQRLLAAEVVRSPHAPVVRIEVVVPSITMGHARDVPDRESGEGERRVNRGHVCLASELQHESSRAGSLNY